MSIFWAGDTRKHESYARNRDHGDWGPDDSAPGIALTLALLAGGIGASLVIVYGGWLISRWVG